MNDNEGCFDYYFKSQNINNPYDYVDEIYDAEPIPKKSKFNSRPNIVPQLPTINENENEDCRHCCDEDFFWEDLYTSFLQWTRMVMS
jgi:hypothetical protein